MRRTVVIVCVLLLAGAVMAQAQDYQVVSNSSVSVDSITAKDLSRLFLKQRTRWASGEHAKPVDLKGSPAVRAAFSDAVLGKTVKAVESYWNGQVFSGKNTPPPELGSDQEVLDYVRRTPGAVGYVSSSASTGGVKVLTVVR